MSTNLCCMKYLDALVNYCTDLFNASFNIDKILNVREVINSIKVPFRNDIDNKVLNGGFFF